MFSYNVLYLPTFQVLDTQAAALSDYKKSMTAKKKNQTFISVILNGLLILSELSEIVTTVQNLLAASLCRLAKFVENFASLPNL